MKTNTEEYIIKKYGEGDASVLFVLAANLNNFVKSFGATFNLDSEQQMILAGYVFQTIREDHQDKQKDEYFELVTGMSGSVKDDDEVDIDEDDVDDGQEDLDFTKDM